MSTERLPLAQLLCKQELHPAPTLPLNLANLTTVTLPCPGLRSCAFLPGTVALRLVPQQKVPLGHIGQDLVQLV